MKILTLIEKDIKLAGNYFWLSIIVLIGIPIFLNQQSGGQYSGIAFDQSAGQKQEGNSPYYAAHQARH